MVKTALGDMSFSVGWKCETTIDLLGKTHTITVKVVSYYESDGISSEQESAIADFAAKTSHYVSIAERLIISAADGLRQAQIQFIPAVLLFNQDGSFALLCDDADDPEDGIAVCLKPSECVMSTDEYL